jgi:hypothetical protein
VPQRHEEDPALGRWVSKQRAALRTDEMDPERKAKLDEIGFYLYLNIMDKWNLQFNKLRAFKESHGHCEFFWLTTVLPSF